MNRFIGVALAAVLALAGCSGSTSSETTSEPAPTTQAAPPPPEPAYWPLTGVAQGEGITDDAPIINPVIGVKIENTSEARPWVGLGSADIVFEEMVEGGLTRFAAIFNSQIPGTAGPVRSLRPMDGPILAPWAGTLIASGGAGAFVDSVESVVPILLHDRGDAGIYRDNSRRAPHNVFADLATMAPSITTAPAIPPLAVFSGEPTATGGASATQIFQSFPGAQSSWTFDATTGRYLRYDSGTASISDGVQISTANVIVLNVTTQGTGVNDAAGNPVPETVLTGSGTGYVFTGGTVSSINWSKGGAAEPFVLTDSAGNPLVLTPGNTWIELMPSQGSMTYQ